MKTLVLWVAVFALAWVPARPVLAKSIFDDDPSSPPNSAPNKPVQESPRPDNRPDPAPPSNTGQPTVPAGPVTPAVTEAPEERLTKETAEKNLIEATARAELAMAGSAEYVRATTALNEARQKLEFARANSPPDGRMTASAEYTAAVANHARVRTGLLATNPEYQVAKRLADKFAPAKEKPDEDFRQAVFRAIANRELLVGMTYDQACKSAKSPPALVTANEKHKIYRWAVRSQTGTRRVLTGQHRNAITGQVRSEYADEPIYRTVGYVYATFAEDKLIGFKRTTLTQPYAQPMSNVPQ